MFKIIFILFMSVYILKSEYLSFEQAVLENPFEIASLGNITLFPNEDAYLFKGENENRNKWFKVNIPKMDTIIFFNEDLFMYQGKRIWVDKLIFSEDGNKILVKTNSKKIWRYSSSGTYFYLDLDNSLLKPLSKNNLSLRNVKFSPNGKYISYVRQDNNIYIYEINKEREKRLTSSGSETISNGHFGWLYEEELTGYDGYRWSPDSKSIAFWEEDQSLVPEFYLIDQRKKYPSLKKIRYPKVGENNPSLKIGVVRVSGAGRKWIQNAIVDNDYLPWLKWVNEQKISFIKLNRKQQKWDMYIADRKTGKSTFICSEIDSNGWLDNHGQIYFLKDNKIIYLSEKTGYNHIWMSKHSGSNMWSITSGKWEVKSIKYIDEKNKLIYFMANKESVYENKLFSITFEGNDLKVITKEKGNHKIQILSSKKYFFDSFSSCEEPQKIILKQLIDGSIVKVIRDTDKKQFQKFEWSNPKIVHFPIENGKDTLSGLITLPPNYDKNKKYPLLIYGYGMPGTQIVWNQWGGIWNQYLVQQGYVVFSMDARGMSGRGERFKNLSYGDMSRYLAKDHLFGVKYLVNHWSIDSSRIGAWGWSGGGYFTCLMLTRNGDFFKAGVAVAPCTDFRLYDTAYTERSMGLLDENRSGYDSTNVLNWINRMKGSLLLIHGSEDDNVHSQHTLQFIDAGLKYGKDIDWIIYPNRNHGIYGFGAREHLYRNMIKYFNLKL